MTEIRAIGLDLSTVASGVAMPWGETRTLRPKATSKDPARRLQEIVYRLDTWLRLARPEVAVIEGYSPGGPGGPWVILRLGELGGAVRVRLFEHGIPFVEVPPTSLKHFATGNGRANKDDMLAAARVAGGDPHNDNEADAFWLRLVALAHYAPEEGLIHRELSPALQRLPWPRLEKEDVPA